MSKTIKKLAICIAFVLASVAFVLFGVLRPNNDNYVQAMEIVCDEIQNEYVAGSQFSVPEATITYGGKQYQATNGVLVFPDGVAKNGSSHMLNQTGKYVVIYTVNCNGVKVRAQKEFVVTENSYSVSSDGSTVTYDVLQTAKVSGMKGLIVNFSGGDTFRYAKPIDLTKQEVTDLIYMYPVKGGTIHNAYIYTVTLTDCYDPSIYVNLIISFDQDWEYIRAHAAGQDEVGLFVPDSRHPGEVEVDGEMYYIHRNNVWGSTGKSPNMDPKGHGCRWLYNYGEQKVYLEERLGPKIINQFNHPGIYDEKQIFKGFTTGEVYLSIKPSSYNATYTQVEIESINGESGEALKLATNYKDEKEPVLTIDFNGVASDNLTAAKGEKFKLFDASAIDINLSGEVKKSVYFNYGNAYQTEISIEDNCFIPNTIGRYTIVYTATDTFGNVAQKTVDVHCREVVGGRGIIFETQHLDKLIAGANNYLPQFDVTGLNGDVTVKIYAERNGEKTEIDATELSFVPLYHGDYKIVYEYFDSIYSYAYSYDVTCVASNEVRFLDDFVLPRHFIKDTYYSIEKIYAYSFENANPTKLDADFKVSFDKGSFLNKDPDKVLITGDFSVQFKFVYGDQEVVSPIIPIVDVNFADMNNLERYFVGDSISMQTAGTSARCDVEAGVGTAMASFINPISVSSFEFRFTIPEDQQFTALNLILTDYYDRTNKKVISYKKVGEKSYFNVNGGLDYEIASPNFFDDGELKRVWYNSKTKMVQNTYSMLIPFDFGFTSDLCLFDVEFVGVTGNASALFRQLNNQSFANLGMDIGDPSIGAKQSSGSYEQGTKVTIYRGYTSDVLSPILTGDFTVSVEGPSGYVTSLDGVLLDGSCDNNRSYEITLDEYGVYVVTYQISGQNGEKTLSYRINVVDEVPPQISFNNLPNGIQVIKINKEYTVADYVVSDNFSSADKVSVTIIIYDEHFGCISVGSKTFVPNKKGVYTIYAYCVDEAGNSSVCSYKVQAQ